MVRLRARLASMYVSVPVSTTKHSVATRRKAMKYALPAIVRHQKQPLHPIRLRPPNLSVFKSAWWEHSLRGELAMLGSAHTQSDTPQAFCERMIILRIHQLSLWTSCPCCIAIHQVIVRRCENIDSDSHSHS